MDDVPKVKRVLHLKMRSPTPDASQLLAFLKAAIPFYRGIAGGRVRLFRNVDDPTQFIQVVEYETPESFELNRQRIAGDPRLRAYLEGWRTMFPGALEMDVFEDVTEG
jgi:hypothetical protein